MLSQMKEIKKICLIINGEKNKNWRRPKHHNSHKTKTNSPHAFFPSLSQPPWRFRGWEVAVYRYFIIIIIFMLVSHYHLLPLRSSTVLAPSQRASFSSLAMLNLKTFSPLVDSKVPSFPLPLLTHSPVLTN